MKKLMLTATSATLSLSAMSQTAEPAAESSFLNDAMLPFYIAAVAVSLLLILVLVVALYVIRVVNLMTDEAARNNALKFGKAYAPKISWWKVFVQKMNASVPVAQEKEIELEHAYDGIRELDNHLPPWWKWLFYGSIVWGVGYYILFHVTDTLPGSLEEYEYELALAEEQVKQYQASQPKAVVDENTLVYTTDAAFIENGKSVFVNNNCAGCHRNDGGGNTIGPNLTDEYWLHGGNIKNIFLTIKNGVVEKGMPAWGKAMSAQDVRDVTFFVMSLQGTNPPDAKAPQGELIKQDVQIESDSLKRQAGL
jgi:cytochrome c oxidase cbb3-type subunit III